jgi:hypothetical protein
VPEGWANEDYQRTVYHIDPTQFDMHGRYIGDRHNPPPPPTQEPQRFHQYPQPHAHRDDGRESSSRSHSGWFGGKSKKSTVEEDEDSSIPSWERPRPTQEAESHHQEGGSGDETGGSSHGGHRAKESSSKKKKGFASGLKKVFKD